MPNFNCHTSIVINSIGVLAGVSRRTEQYQTLESEHVIRVCPPALRLIMHDFCTRLIVNLEYDHDRQGRQPPVLCLPPKAEMEEQRGKGKRRSRM
jgi:hypothetical protein